MAHGPFHPNCVIDINYFRNVIFREFFDNILQIVWASRRSNLKEKGGFLGHLWRWSLFFACIAGREIRTDVHVSSDVFAQIRRLTMSTLRAPLLHSTNVDHYAKWPWGLPFPMVKISAATVVWSNPRLRFEGGEKALLEEFAWNIPLGEKQISQVFSGGKPKKP